MEYDGQKLRTQLGAGSGLGCPGCPACQCRRAARLPSSHGIQPTRPWRLAAGTPERARADQLMRLERRFFSDWLGWLTSDWNHAR